MNEWAIETSQLCRQFGKKKVLDNLNMKIPHGSVYGFLGKNGTGKTTTLRILAGFLIAQKGESTLLGHSSWRQNSENKRNIAYLTERMNVPAKMKVSEAIRFNSSLFPDWNKEMEIELLRQFQLNPTDRFGILSRGQQRLLMILLTLCQPARIYLFDEPASGLDVSMRRLFLDAILSISRMNDRTIVIASHQLNDLERVVDHIGILQDGKINVQGNIENLKDQIKTIHCHSLISCEIFREHFQVLSYSQPDRNTTIATVRNFDEKKLKLFSKQNFLTEIIQVHSLNLEDLFIELTQNKPIQTETIDTLSTGNLASN